jgi:hypothetical protein
MIELSTTIDRFARMLAPISSITDECILNIWPSNLEVSAVDPANVAMASVRLPKALFKNYIVDESRQVALDLTELKAIVEDPVDGSAPLDIAIYKKPAEKSRHPTLKDEVDFIRLTSPPLKYEAQLEDIETLRRPPKLIEFRYDTECSGLPILSVRDLIKKAFRIDNYLVMTSSKGKGTDANDTDCIKLTSDDGKHTISAKFRDSDKRTLITVHEEASCLYTLDYLSDIIRSCHSDTVDIRFSTNSPMMMYFNILESGDATFFVAPRIESE